LNSQRYDIPFILIIILIFISFSCDFLTESESNSDKDRLIGIWTSSGESFEKAKLSTLSVKFNEDNTYILGDYINNEFHASDLIGENQILEYEIDSEKEQIITIQTNIQYEDWIIRDTMFYDFYSDKNLLIQFSQKDVIDTTYYYKQE